MYNKGLLLKQIAKLEKEVGEQEGIIKVGLLRNAELKDNLDICRNVRAGIMDERDKLRKALEEVKYLCYNGHNSYVKSFDLVKICEQALTPANGGEVCECTTWGKGYEGLECGDCGKKIKEV